MEWIFFALLAYGAWMLFRPKPKDPPRTSSVPTIDIRVERHTEPSPWISRDFAYGPRLRPEGYVVMKNGSDINVAGTSYRLEQARSFIRHAKDGQAKLELERQPFADHPNAIAVYGKAGPDAERVHIGFVPSEVSALVAGSFSPEMPLAAELRRAGQHKTEGAIFIAFNILVPNAATRRKNGWN